MGHETSAAPRPQPRPSAARRAAIAGVAIPVAVTVLALGVEVAILSDLPDPVATHWSGSGPDGFSPPWVVPVLTAAFAGLMPLAMGLSAVLTIRRGDRGFTLRLLPAVAAGLSAFLSALMVGSLWGQRGLADAAQAPSITGAMLASVSLGTLVGVAGWLIQPPRDAVDVSRRPAQPLPLETGEQAVWVGRTEMSAPVMAALIASVALLGVLAAIMWFTADVVVAIVTTASAVLVAVLAASFTSFVVRADRAGLTVRSSARTVTLRVPAGDIAQVAVTDVSGLAQYGGFGVRMIPGATAVVLRSGPALEVTRSSGRRLVVTMDHAAAAAAVLAAAAGVEPEGAPRADQD